MASIRSQSKQMKPSTVRKIPRIPARITCQYTNQTEQVQVICITGTRGVGFERTVMPQQKIVFEAPSESVLEVRTGGVITAIASDRIPCIRLRDNPEDSRKTRKANSLSKRAKRKKAARRTATRSPKQLSA
ncbi:MAG: DUF1830 domain-containing protein [Cyanobacteria bacterium J06621_11]